MLTLLYIFLGLTSSTFTSDLYILIERIIPNFCRTILQIYHAIGSTPRYQK